METAKSRLYQSVDNLRKQFKVSFDQPIDTVNLLGGYSDRYSISVLPFKTPGLCGIAMVGSKCDTIALNSNRDRVEHNFDCAHELIHLHEHRNKQESFNCFTKVKIQQDSFIEWQANEGAAQFLVPFQDFIPRFVNMLDSTHRDIISHAKFELASHYGVPEQVINLRIDNLSYEIDQYRAGVSIDRIQLLSRAQRQRMGIRPTSYLAFIEGFAPVAHALDWDSVIG